MTPGMLLDIQFVSLRLGYLGIGGGQVWVIGSYVGQATHVLFAKLRYDPLGQAYCVQLFVVGLK